VADKPDFGASGFGFPSDFGLRPSDFVSYVFFFAFQFGPWQCFIFSVLIYAQAR
jgi:hypothetical protein